MTLGQINLENFKELTTLPQKAASAWTGATADLIGATFKPIIYLGDQLVHGTNYFFIAERTIIYRDKKIRNVVKVKIYEVNGEYTLTEDEIL